MKILEQNILQSNFQGNNDDSSFTDIERNKFLLKNLLEERGKGALIRARYTHLNEMDAPIAFFWTRKKVQRQEVFSLFKTFQ